MSTRIEILIRFIFTICLVFLLLTDFSGIIGKLIKGSQDETGNHPVPTNPGYGDSNKHIDLDADIEDDSIKKFDGFSSKVHILSTLKNACLPKLICELNATPRKDKLTESEKSLLYLIRDTSINTRAELTTKYHFAAHMGQLISGIDGNGCHHFYPSCPFPGLEILQIMKKVRMR